jgi:ankyrin repeat protein
LIDQQNQQLQKQNQDQQQQIEQLQQQQPEEIESDDDDDDDEYDDGDDDRDDDDDDDDRPLVMSNSLRTACRAGDMRAILRLLDGGKNVNCVSSVRMTPIMLALWRGHLHAAIMLVGRGADLSVVDNHYWNLLQFAAASGNRQCIEWVLANTTIDVNLPTKTGCTPIKYALIHGHLDAGKLLV